MTGTKQLYQQNEGVKEQKSSHPYPIDGIVITTPWILRFEPSLLLSRYSENHFSCLFYGQINNIPVAAGGLKIWWCTMDIEEELNILYFKV